MKLGVGRWAGILVLVLISAACWPNPAPSGRDRSPPGPRVVAAWEELTPAIRSARAPINLPNPILGVAAMTTGAWTSLVGVGPNGTQPLMEPMVIDGDSTVLRGSALSYLLLPGPDPSQNYIEAHNLAEGLLWEIKPDKGGVIFGFAVDPAGSQLVYLEVDSRPSGTQPPWRVVAVELDSGTRSAILDSERDGNTALQPVDWASGAILLRGLTPFSPHYRGLWSVRPDGSDLRQLLNEFDFVGGPRLSPQGDRLALLSPDPAAQPPVFGRGEPGASVIQILDLISDLRIPVLVRDSQHELTDLEWGAGSILAVQAEWDEELHAFVPRRVVRLPLEGDSPPEVLYSTIDGEIMRLAGCPNEGWLAAVRVGKMIRIVRGTWTKPIASIGPGDLDYLTCLAGSSSGSTRALAGVPTGPAWSKARG